MRELALFFSTLRLLRALVRRPLVAFRLARSAAVPPTGSTGVAGTAAAFEAARPFVRKLALVVSTPRLLRAFISFPIVTFARAGSATVSTVCVVRVLGFITPFATPWFDPMQHVVREAL